MVFHTHPSITGTQKKIQNPKQHQPKKPPPTTISVTSLTSQDWRGTDETYMRTDLSNTEVNILKIYCDYSL